MPFNQDEKLFLIQWFSNVLCHELSEDQFDAYEKGTFDSLFQLLDEYGFHQPIKQIKQTLADLKGQEWAYLELAADFTEAFLLDGESSALPYASVYLTEDIQPSHFAFMDEMLVKCSLKLNRANKEPSDHLGVYLALLHQLVLHADVAEQSQFVQGYFLPWLQDFYAKLQRIPTKTPFYQAIVGILIGFLSA